MTTATYPLVFAAFTADGFAGIGDTEQGLYEEAAQLGIAITKIVPGLLADVAPVGATLIYEAEWNEVIETESGKAGKRVLAI
jgi:hypothetical protein